MKNVLILLTLALFIVVSCGKIGRSGIKLSSDKDTVAYYIGVMQAKRLKSGLASDDFDKVKPEIIAKAFEQVFSGDSIKISDMKMQSKIQDYFTKLQIKMNSTNLQEGKDFLEKNKKNSDVHVTKSGLQYKIIKDGTGPKPDSSDMVSINYAFTSIKGEKTPSSASAKPVSFPVKGVFRGWTEAILQMHVGSKWQLVVPAELGFGEQGNRNLGIKPNMPMIMEVELLNIEPKQKQQAPPMSQPKMQMKK
jgi:FKBP-type peptidyl-prolyl cis-trans isomerase FklB